MIRNIKQDPGLLASLKNQLAQSEKQRSEFLQQKTATENLINKQLAIIKNSGSDGETPAAVEQINSIARFEIRQLDNLNIKLSRQIEYCGKQIASLNKQIDRASLGKPTNITSPL